MKSRALVLGVAAALMGACGDDTTADERDAAISVPDAGGDASVRFDGGDASQAADGSVDGALDAGPLACEDDQVACVGACLSNVGEVQNGCELVLPASTEVEFATVAGGSLIARVSRYREPRISKFDLDSFEETVLYASDSIDTILLTIVDDFIYYRGSRVVEGRGVGAFYRLSVAGGEPQYIADTRAYDDNIEVAGGYVWFVGPSSAGVQRVPVTGGSLEDVMAFSNIDSLTFDDTHYYFHQQFPDFTLGRTLRTDPTVVEHFGGTRITAVFYKWPGDDDTIFVADFDGTGIVNKSPLADRNISRFSGLSGDQGGEVRVTAGQAMSKDGTVETFEAPGPGASYTSDAAYFYVVQNGGLARIAR